MPDTVAAESELISEYLCRIARFALAACENAADPSCPGMDDHRPNAGLAALVERPIGHRHARIDHDIRMADKENRRHRIVAPASGPLASAGPDGKCRMVKHPLASNFDPIRAQTYTRARSLEGTRLP